MIEKRPVEYLVDKLAIRESLAETETIGAVDIDILGELDIDILGEYVAYKVERHLKTEHMQSRFCTYYIFKR